MRKLIAFGSIAAIFLVCTLTISTIESKRVETQKAHRQSSVE